MARQHTGHSGILVTNEVETLIVQALLFESIQVFGPFHAYFGQKSIHMIWLSHLLVFPSDSGLQNILAFCIELVTFTIIWSYGSCVLIILQHSY